MILVDLFNTDLHELLSLLLYAIVLLASGIFLMWTTSKSWGGKRNLTAVVGGFLMLLGSFVRLLSSLIGDSLSQIREFGNIISGDLLSASLATFFCLIIWTRK
jgi:hypothetical protein